MMLLAKIDRCNAPLNRGGNGAILTRRNTDRFSRDFLNSLHNYR